MNIFAFISLLASVVTFFMGIVGFHRNPKSVLNRFFLLYCLSGAYWTFTEFGYRQADNFDTAFLWMKIGAFWPFVTTFLLHFALVFTEKSKLLENKLIYAIYVPPLTFSLLDLTKNLITTEPVKVYWGWTYSTAKVTLSLALVNIWSIGTAILSLYLCFRYYQQLTEHEKKQQAKNILIGVTIPVLMGSISQGLLRNIGIMVPELTSFGFFVGNHFLGAAIWKYKLLTLNSATAAENIISTMADALLLVNPVGKIVTVNQAALKLLGYEKSELINQPVEIIFPQEYRFKEAWLEQLIAAGSISDIETTFNTKDNRKNPISLSLSLIRDKNGTEHGVVYIGRDLTARKQTEEELNESKRRLEKSLANLDAKNKELESFVYTVSHDLKAPLVSLEGFASILLDKYKDSMDEKGQLYLSRIQANVEKMGHLIQDLLELSRIGRIVHAYEPVDATEIIREVIETLQIQLLERGTELVIHDNLPSITCDRVRIKQVFLNLIDNANKYMGEENNKPRIEIGFHEKGDFFEFFVKDNGIGIQKEYHEKVFEIFTRLWDVDVEGTGVGLTIVKKIIETHGGKIWIDSEAGKGTTVYFTLPKTR